MADAKSSRGMIAVDKMGTKALFLNLGTMRRRSCWKTSPHCARTTRGAECQPRLCADLRRRLEGVPKAAQIARCAPDNSLIGVTRLNSGTVSLDGRPQSRLAVSRWTWHSAMTNCFCQVTGLFASSIFQSGAQSTASAPARAVNPFSFVGRRAISAV
jgi:hypothetical protein